MPANIAQAAAAGRAWANDLRLGGSLLTIAGVTILMGIITAEALYPHAYSTGGSEISDLGGTRPPNSLIFQPSATIFDLSMVAIGILVMAGSWFAHRVFRRRSVTLPLTVLGIGALGVGLFPGNTGAPHAMFAMVTFVAGGVAAVSAARVATAPFRVVSLLLGGASLLTLASYILLGAGSPMAAFGIGGIERWIVYPVILWVIAFGGYLSGRADGTDAAAIA
ncbi:MAG: hypothetical protein QOF49_268 [Chloroflexota bacterium]|nr:hypothetical protein [Chloroflexota bacterium]